jgi:hypothetical protein
MTSPVFKDGMTVTIRRGKNRGETAEVETVHGDQVVVKLQSGGIALISADSLKAPEVPTVDANTLADAMTRAGDNYGAGVQAAFYALADDLGKVVPGFSAESLNFAQTSVVDGGSEFS